MDEIALKRFAPDNIILTFNWVQDKELRRLFTMRGEPTWETHTAYFEKLLKDETQIIFAIYKGDRHIGNCGLKNIKGETGELWIYIGDKSERGKGHGKKASQKLVEVAFNKLRLRRLYLHVLADNLPAISMYKSLGFKEVAFDEESEAVWKERDLDIIKMERTWQTGKKYFVIGGGVLQCDFIETVKSMGYETHVFDYNPQCPGAEIADVFHCISINDIDKVLEKAREFDPVGIQTVATEIGNITACCVGEKMGLLTNTCETALNTTDKSRMKTIFAANNIPNAKYIEAEDISEVDVESLPYPVVLKPSDSSAGRGVTLVREKGYFASVFETAKTESSNKKVLIEEVLQGKQFSAETISADGKHYIVMFTEEYLDGSDDFIESQHLNPARLTVAEEKDLTALIFKTLDAFHIRYGAGHIEVKLTRDGFKVIEIASRMGGYRDKLAELATGCHYDELLVKATTGQKIEIKRTIDCWALVKFMFNEYEYEFYRRLKKESPELIVRDGVRAMSRKKAKCLMDATGFYFIRLDKSRNPDDYIRGSICQ